LYKFDYVEYENRNKKLIQSNFSGTYNLLYLNLLSIILKTKIINNTDGILNKFFILNFTSNFINNNLISKSLKKFIINDSLINNINNLNIDEI
jgi:hypothetical protein